FDARVSPVYDFLNATPDRVPMTDWYQTTDARKVGFQARSVVGGVLIKLLADPAVWKKWASRDRATTGNWAPLPPRPRVVTVVPTAEREPVIWRYTFEKPAPNWFQPGFSDAGWKEGPAGFGTPGTPGAVVRTLWNTTDLWIRRQFTMPAGHFPNLRLWVDHDEDVEIY